MKNYSKHEAIKIIVASAEQYEENLMDKKFLIAYKSGKKIGFCQVAFSKKNFLHFTGVDTKLPAENFFDAARSCELSVRDFELPRNGNVFRKLDVLPLLPQIFKTKTLRGDFNRIGVKLEADYFIGDTKKRFSVGFRRGRKFDMPVTLYNEDIKKMTLSTDKVISVWKRGRQDKSYINIFCDEDYKENVLFSEWALHKGETKASEHV